MTEEKTNDAENLAKLCLKIEEISKEIGALKEDEKNVHSNYSYISYQQMDAKLRTMLSEKKLSIIPQIVKQHDEISTFIDKDSKGNEKQRQIIRTTVEGDFKIVDLETGYNIVRHWIGVDQDYGGKSGGQAITEFCKRFYFKLFKISSKEDIDPDSKTIEVQGKAVPKGGRLSLKPDSIMPFGKHKDQPMKTIPRDYLEWLRDNDNRINPDEIQHIINFQARGEEPIDNPEGDPKIPE
jgi:hypothetical protein